MQVNRGGRDSGMGGSLYKTLGREETYAPRQTNKTKKKKRSKRDTEYACIFLYPTIDIACTSVKIQP